MNNVIDTLVLFRRYICICIRICIICLGKISFINLYRSGLVPGFGKVLQDLTPNIYPGRVCLSVAGQSILALAISNLELIAEATIQYHQNLRIFVTIGRS